MLSVAPPRPTDLTVTDNWGLRRRTQMFDMSAMLVLVCFGGAIMSRRPEILALGAPFLVAITASLVMWKPFEGQVTMRTSA